MEADPTEWLSNAFDAFIEAPTQNKQDSLLAAAAAYRDHWIEAQAARPTVSKARVESSGPPTRYKRLLSVDNHQRDGTELTLALQSRTSVSEGGTWYVVSWRTRLGPGGPNRRFYVTRDEPWSLPASTALNMLEKLEALGGLEEKYFDLNRRKSFDVVVSDDLSNADRQQMLEEITMADESWGADPYFVVAGDLNAAWRKIMLVNRETAQVTFRSTTKSENYMPRKTLRSGSIWFLDNSMQDSNVQQCRAFIALLRKLAPSLTP